MRRRARIIGAGLIGTSIALKLRELGWSVEIEDVDPSARRLAEDLIGNFDNSAEVDPELVVVATPTEAAIGALKMDFERYPQAIFIDVGSTKNNLQLQVENISGLKERFIGTHPIAGREISGAEGARSDLFQSRAWIVTPSSANQSEDLERVKTLIAELGATPYEMSPERHDQLFARISHLPQILSTALAKSIEGLADQIEIAGQGLRDQLRLAGSNGHLWSGILTSNKAEVVPALDELIRILKQVREDISEENEVAVQELFKGANDVHARLSGKHGAKPRAYKYLNVVIADKPGQLSALFNECAKVSANVEDISLEHSPNQETGLIQLALSDLDADRLFSHLIAQGWKVHRA